MAPTTRSSRATKRAKVSDAQSSDGNDSRGSHIFPDSAPSSEPEESRETQAHVPVAVAAQPSSARPALAAAAAAPPPLPVVGPPAMIDISSSLLQLGASKTEPEAVMIIKSLSPALEDSFFYAREFFDVQGLSVIMSSLLRFTMSERYVEEALASLAALTHHLGYVTNVGKVLLQLKFLDTVISLARTHSNSAYIPTYIVMSLDNLTAHADPQSKFKFGTSEAVQFVLDSMTAHPDKIDLLCSASSYCWEMSKIPEVKDILLEKGAVQILGTLFGKYRQWNDNNADEQTKSEVSIIVGKTKAAITELVR